MEIIPYESFGPLKFNKSTMDECIQLFGHPRQKRINRLGKEELRYDHCIVRFTPIRLTVWECTLLPRAEATIAGIKVTWDIDFLLKACESDGSPRDAYGFIVFQNLGIAVTGIHDNDSAQLAITAFSRGEFDEVLAKSIPFVLEL